MLLALVAMLLVAGTVAAQYAPIPDETGANFRADINSRLSGATPITPLLQTNQATVAVVSSSSASSSSLQSSITINAPATIANGNTLIALAAPVGVGTSVIVTPPAGWTALGSNGENGGNGATLATYCKVAGASEPSSYNFAFSPNAYPAVAIIQVSGANGCAVDGSSAAIGVAASVTIPAFTPARNNDYILGAGVQYGQGAMTPARGAPLVNLATNNFAVSGFVNAYGQAPSLTFTGGTTNAIVGVEWALPSARMLQSPAAQQGQSNVIFASSTASANGVINVKAPPYNAQGDGQTDDTGAIQAAIYAACAATPPTQPASNAIHQSIYFPAGTYFHAQPLRLTCGESMSPAPARAQRSSRRITRARPGLSKVTAQIISPMIRRWLAAAIR